MPAVRTFGDRFRRLPALLCALLAIYLFVYIWSVPMLMLDLVPSWGEWMGGCLIILQGMLMAAWLWHQGGTWGAVAALAIAVLSYLVEYIGVTRGTPFGSYGYTPTLGLQLGAVPLAIPFAWLIVVPGAVAWSISLRRPLLVVVAAALLALWLDLLIEPVAAYVVQYWQWHESGPYYGVPTTNFLAWAGTALILAAILLAVVPSMTQASQTIWVARLLFWLNTVQFTLVNAAYGYWIATMLGCGLLLSLGLLARRRAPASLLNAE
jgi:bisanhydrobacterioruberin hydratase